jgi:hypothetical protein
MYAVEYSGPIFREGYRETKSVVPQKSAASNPKIGASIRPFPASLNPFEIFH